MDVSSYAATGSKAGAASDFKSRTRVADSGSRIILSANEDLGGGMRAGVYCETGINIDNGSATGQNDSGNGNTSEFCSREGRASIASGAYELRLGRQNVWWTQGELNQVGSTFLGSDTATNLQNGGAGVYGVRLENMIKVAVTSGQFAGSELYTGFMGISGSAAGVATNVTNPNGEAATAGKDANATYSGGKLLYTAGQLVAMWDFQTSKNSTAIATTSAGGVGVNSFDRTANKVGLGFKYNPTSLVSAQYWTKSRTDKTTPGAAFVSMFSAGAAATAVTSTGDAKDSGFSFVVKHDLGGGLMAHGQYSKANNIKAGSADVEQVNTGATAYTLGVTKALSKRTHLLGSYHMIKNQENAAYNMTGGTYHSGTSRTGADVKILAIGMIHNF